MATEAKIKITFGFADESTRDIDIGPYPGTTDSAIQLAKTRIKNFNPEPIASLFLSDEGASCTGIVDARVIVTSINEIDLNVEG